MARLAQVGVAYRYYFNVHRGGVPRTGLVLANFDISVRNPQNTASDVPGSLTEVGNGRYFFDVLAAFSTTHGAGQYHANIEITLAPFSLGGGPIEYFAESIDTLARRSEYTAARAGFLDELGPTNLPADVDTLLARLTAGRAANLDEITAARLAELDPANLPADIDALTVAVALVLSTGGAGPWTGLPGVADWTAAEREQIRDSLGVDGTKTAATGGQQQDILADAAELNDTKITVARAANLDEITAARLSELDAGNLPADVGLVLSTGGPGPWTTGSGASPAVVAAAVWATAVPGAFLPGSAAVVLAGIVAAIQGADSRDLTELAGAGWLPGTDTLEEIRNAIDALGVPPIVGHAVNPTVIP